MQAVLYSMLLLFTLWAGGEEKPRHNQSAQTIPNASGLYLTKNHRGDVVMSWVEGGMHDHTGVVKLAISRDGGKTFGTPILVPFTERVGTAHGECQPKIAFRKDGTLVVVYRVDEPTNDNPHGGNMYFVTSPDEGKTWSEKQLLLPEAARSRAFFDVATLPDGEVGVVWLEGKDHHDHDKANLGSSLKFARTDHSNRFTAPVMVSKSVCQCCKTRLYADAQGQLHVVFRKIFEDGTRDIAHVVSSDLGKSFSQPATISPDKWQINGCPHVGPDVVAKGKDLHFVWYSNGNLYRNLSKNNGKTFSPRVALAPGKRASHPYLTALPNGAMLIVWDESVPAGEKNMLKVGMQITSADGKSRTEYLPADKDSERPFVLATGPDSVLLAFTQSDEHSHQIVYQTISVK